MKKLKYTHPASCGYSAKKIYSLDELKDELDINMIKILFEPVDFTWDELESENDTKTEYSNEVKENIEEIDGTED